MSLVRPAVFDPTGLMRADNFGDIQITNEIVPATNAGTAVTLTGPLLALGMFLSSAASAPTLTFDTAANIVNALAAQFGYNQNAGAPLGTNVYQAIQNGTSFRFKVIISTAFAVTLAAATGVTVNRGSVPASSSRDFLLTVTNGTPAQTFSCVGTSGSAVLTGLSQAQLSQLSPGMLVTASPSSAVNSATILSVNLAAGTVTVSANASASFNGAVTFSPTITVDGL